MHKIIPLALLFFFWGCQTNTSPVVNQVAATPNDSGVTARVIIPTSDSLPLDDTNVTSIFPKPVISKPEPKQKLPQKAKKSNDPDILDKKYITGKFNQRTHQDFTRLDDKYCAYPDMYLRKEVYAAFLKMRSAAEADGIHLIIRSATRNFFTQKRIWENKWTGKKAIAGGENLAKTTKDPVQRALKILRYSSMPGSSRHHWGTDIDLNDLANSYFEKGKGYKMYQWMLQNAHDYGFYLVYTEKGPQRKTGYNEERWHWTYLPTSKKILAQAKKVLKDEDFSGFLGANTAPKINIVKNYVLGVNPECL